VQNKKIEHNYIEILRDSLVKKIMLLDELIKINEDQKNIITGSEFMYEEFDEIIDKKNFLIKELNSLDDGFTSVYNRVKELLQEEKDKYKEDIVTLKELITQVTDRTVTLGVSEKNNKTLLDKRTNELKMEVKTARTSNKVAADYYQSMNKLNVIEPQFMDKKK
jgi:flagellar biosynthesis/type III secretory pathway chaperone